MKMKWHPIMLRRSMHISIIPNLENPPSLSLEQLRTWNLRHLEKARQTMECFICKNQIKILNQNLTKHYRKCEKYGEFWRGEGKYCPEFYEAIEQGKPPKMTAEQVEWHALGLKKSLHDLFPDEVGDQTISVYLRMPPNRSVDFYVGMTANLNMRENTYRFFERKIEMENNNNKNDSIEENGNKITVVFLTGLSRNGARFLEYLLIQMAELTKSKGRNDHYEQPPIMERQHSDEEWRKKVMPLLMERIHYGEPRIIKVYKTSTKEAMAAKQEEEESSSPELDGIHAGGKEEAKENMDEKEEEKVPVVEMEMCKNAKLPGGEMRQKIEVVKSSADKQNRVRQTEISAPPVPADHCIICGRGHISFECPTLWATTGSSKAADLSNVFSTEDGKSKGVTAHFEEPKKLAKKTPAANIEASNAEQPAVNVQQRMMPPSADGKFADKKSSGNSGKRTGGISRGLLFIGLGLVTGIGGTLLLLNKQPGQN